MSHQMGSENVWVSFYAEKKKHINDRGGEGVYMKRI